MKRSFSIIVIFIALAILGCALIPRLPVKLMPSRTLPSLTVSFSMPNAASRVVEREVTSKLEGLLARIQGVKEINSTSNNGGGYVTIGFDKHTDMEQARFEASTIIRQAWSQMPDGVSYPSISASRTIAQSARPVLSYTLVAPDVSSKIMRYAEDNIRPVIGRLDGVNRVQFSGATPMEWRLTYDSGQLQSLGLTPYRIQEAIASQAQTTFLGSGMTESEEWLSLICSSSSASDEEFDISKIYITTADSTIISLDRLLTAEYKEAEPSSYYRVNGLTSIYCNIYAEEDANQLEVAKNVREAIDGLNLPAGYSMIINYDSTESISKELDKIYVRTGLTLIILLFFVALITLNLRYTLVIIISLGLSLAASVIFYYLLGIEIQLYSLAGITISLNLMIDNIIVMGDHYRRKKDLRAFTAMLAATLTTIGALGIVFFLDDELKLNLQDFVAVVIINLTVSLVASLWLVPALIERLEVYRNSKSLSRRRAKLIRRLNNRYSQFICFARRWRIAFIAIAILAFGLPVFMLPKEIEGCGLYNKTFGSKVYNEKIRPWVNRILGGSLRLFIEDVYEGSYFNREISDPVLQISASLPNGSTLSQMNDLVQRMESFLSGFSEIKQFRTEIYSPYQANISVQFKNEYARNGFPYQLKAQVISKALTLGGGSWSVYGLEDLGFNNSIMESAGNYQVKLTGYNYDELETLTERFRHKLLSHFRIKEVTVSSEFSWYKDDFTELYINIDRNAMARQGLGINELYAALSTMFGRGIYCGYTHGSSERILLESQQSDKLDVWALMNMPLELRENRVKLSDFATIVQANAPKSVVKENQQYIMCLQYEYIGSDIQGQNLLEKDIEEFRPSLPMGYTIENVRQSYSWRNSSKANYWLLVLIVAIIFWITAILFASIRQSLVIILTIPISLIGVFLAFFLTGLNFDQGGGASFVLVIGITVNATIYLLNEQQRTRSYIHAFNSKIIPIFLTIMSSILGFIPFIVGPDAPEPFWFSLAIGTIGGLVASLPAIFIIVPLFCYQIEVKDNYSHPKCE